jgi:hypothetical protein
MNVLASPNEKRGCTTVLAVIGGVVLTLLVCVFFATFTELDSAAAPSGHQVVYKVTTERPNDGWPACFTFDTTYDLHGGTAQKSVGICDGARSVQVDQFTGARGDFVYLSAQNDEYFARFGCQIFIDNQLVYQTHSEGQYVIASCSGSVP